MKRYNPYLKLILLTLLIFISMLLVSHGEAKENKSASALPSTSQLSNDIQTNNFKSSTTNSAQFFVYQSINQQNSQTKKSNLFFSDSTNKPAPFENKQPDEISSSNENAENTLIITVFILIALFITRISASNLYNKYFLNIRALISSLTLNWFIPIKASLL